MAIFQILSLACLPFHHSRNPCEERLQHSRTTSRCASDQTKFGKMARANHFKTTAIQTAKDAEYAKKKLDDDNVVEFPKLPEFQRIKFKTLALERACLSM